MKIKEIQEQGIKDFVRMIKHQYQDQYTAIVTVHDNKGCGLYVKKDREYLDIPCLAVACLKDGTWIGLGYDLELFTFPRDQVL